MATDDLDEVRVTSGGVKPYAMDKRGVGRTGRGLSPLMSGLLYGGAAASVAGGPLGLLVGLASGIVSKRMRDSELDRAARETRLLSSEDEKFNSQMNEEMKLADPDEQRALKYAARMKDVGLKRLMNGDQRGRDMWNQANQVMLGLINGDMQGRKADEAANASALRGLTTDAATAYRNEYQAAMAQFDETDKQANSVLSLTSQAGFDPNKPFNKAVLADMLSVGIGGLYKDSPEGIERMAASVPIIGQFLQGGVEMFKSSDFKLTAEDFNRIAVEIKNANAASAKSKMSRLGNQATQLDAFARSNGITAQDFSLSDYVTGAERTLRLTPAPKTPTSNLNTKPITTDQDTSQKLYDLPISESMRGLEKWINKRKQNAPRPTN